MAHDDLPYASDQDTDIYGWLKREGRFVPTRRTTGISTSDLITRIVRDYDTYVRRNLARGVPASELGLSYLRSKELQLTADWGRWWQQGKEALLSGWEQVSEGWVSEFAGAFSAHGTTHIFNRQGEIATNEDGLIVKLKSMATKALDTLTTPIKTD